MSNACFAIWRSGDVNEGTRLRRSISAHDIATSAKQRGVIWNGSIWE
jgi:hypothetical protein